MLSKEFHIHANSTGIQERHRKLYEELYHACPTVVSAPAILLWSPTYAVGPGGVGIVSKLPLRLHFGIEPKSTPGVEFGPMRYYIPERDEFQDWDTSRCNPILLRLLEHVAKHYEKTVGARLWCISEVPWYRGLNVDPLCAAPAAVAWLLHLGAVTSAEIAECVKLPSDKLAGSKPFEKIFRLAWKLESAIANWLADGHMSFGVLVDAEYPVVFFRERDPFLFDHYRDLGVEHPSSYYNASDGLFFRGVRLNELFQLDSHPAWPIDIALVFTGEEGDSRFVYRTRGAFKAKLEEAAAASTQTFENLVPETFRQTPKFLELAKTVAGQSPGMNLFQVYRETSVVHSMTVFKALHDLFQYGADPHVLRDFFQSQNICQHILRILGLSPLAVSRPQTILRLAGNKYNEIGVMSRLIGPGDHGCLMVVGPSNTLEPVLAHALPVIRHEVKKTVHCHWASWCDGMAGSDGARVEQHVETGVYAHFTAAESITVREWNGVGTTPAVLYTTEKWEAEREKFDVLLDGREGRIFVRGKPLTSSEIHSAKQTIELFRQFFSKGAHELPATSLPASCYRRDRNQMESKIVRPLVGVVKELTGKQLGLEIHGGLGSNFKVCFAPERRVRVGVVDKPQA